MQSSSILLLTSLVVASAAPAEFLAPSRLSSQLAGYPPFFGVDSPSSPEEIFQKYYDVVVKDADVNKTISELLDWAKEEVQKSAGEIEANLKDMSRRSANSTLPVGYGSAFNLLWPGIGYSSVSFGGSFEVLSLLQTQGMLHIGGIVGASSGATSGILALADTSSSSRSLLFYYHVMEAYKTDTGDKETYQLAPYLVNLYEHAIRGDESFASVQRRYLPMAVCTKSPGRSWSNSVNTGFLNCATRQQCAQATQASSDATEKGWDAGDAINGVEAKCADISGSVRSFPDANNISNIFFNSYYGMDTVTTITLDSIKKLFKAGVTDTISLLKSPKLQVPCTGECDFNVYARGVRAEVQAPNTCVTCDTCTQWYDLQSGSSTTTPSGCHAWH